MSQSNSSQGAASPSTPRRPQTTTDEALVPPYTLPDPLLDAQGRPIRSASSWTQRRRGEILELFRTHLYGHAPQRPPLRATLEQGPVPVLGGRGMRRMIRLALTGGPSPVAAGLMLYTPAGAGPHPCFLGLNFAGNQGVSSEPDIPLSTAWHAPTQDGSVVGNRATDQSRGKESRRYPLELILARGYALATCYYGDIEPDHAQGWKDGVRGRLQPAGTPLAPGDWGAIAAWAWGLSCALDYLQTDASIAPEKVAVIGHSRLGKAALWAGAQDQRFAMVISNDSGQGGAAIARRHFGETVAAINFAFPHWFAANYQQYNENEAALPVDQHELIALIAPRPVYIASASEDLWADPKGEFLAARHAGPIYELLGKPGLGRQEMPPAGQSIGDNIGYHLRGGKHDLLRFDWEQYLNFADRHLR